MYTDLYTSAQNGDHLVADPGSGNTLSIDRTPALCNVSTLDK